MLRLVGASVIVGGLDLNRGCLPFRFPPPRHDLGANETIAEDGTLEAASIPKLVHFIWIGSPIPEKYVLGILKLRAHNPGYRFVLWTDSRSVFDHADHAFAVHLANFQTVVEVHHSLPRLRNRDLFDAETNMGAKADILRYELVYLFGGIYLDVDHDSLGPGSLPPAMQRPFVQVSGPPWYNTTNSDFGFGVQSPFLFYVIAALRDPRLRLLTDIPSRTGPTFFTTCVVSYGDPSFIHPAGTPLLALLHHRGDHNWR